MALYRKITVVDQNGHEKCDIALKEGDLWLYQQDDTVLIRAADIPDFRKALDEVLAQGATDDK